MTKIYWPDFATRSHSPESSSWQHIGLIFRLSPTPLPLDAFEMSNSYWYGKTRMAGESLVMIDSVVLAHYINVTDT